MSLINWGITVGVKSIIKNAEKDGRVAEAVDVADSTIKGFFPDAPEEIKQMLVQHVIFPFCRIWLKNDPAGWAKAKDSLNG